MIRTAALASLLAWLVPTPCTTPAAAQQGGIADPAEYSAKRMLALWRARTAGTNLALGKAVTFSPTPAYHLTVKGGTDTRDLVDGTLSEASNQAIWWEEKAVGWNGNRGELKTIIVDLGKPLAVGRVVWRFVAGCRKRSFYGPKRVRLSGGLDGRHVHLVGERLRWRDDVAAGDTYRLPNLGPPEMGDDVYVYPLEIDAGNHRMRYVVLEFEMDGNWLASDELAVIAGSGEGRHVAKLPKRVLQTRDVWVLSDEPSYPVLADTALPLWLRQRDLRPTGAKLAVRYEFELPPKLELRGPPYYKATTREDGKLVFSYPRGGNSRRIGPFFLRGAPDGPCVLRLRALGESAAPQPWVSVSISAAELPPPFRLARLSASIGWMVDRDQELWPDFHVAYARLGFNTVPTFPRAWAVRALKNGLSVERMRAAADPASLTEKGRRLNRLRALGYKIVYMESPIHFVNWTHPEDAKEFKCQLPGAVPVEPTFCPSYRGKHFEQEVQRIADHTLMVGPPDIVLWDWEIAGSGTWLGKRCSRCQKLFQASGLDWDTFAKRQTLGILDALNAAVRDTCARRGWPRPQLGMYNLDAVEVYSGVFDYKKDKRLDFQSPSLYVGDDPRAVHDRIRRARRIGGSNRIIPWLTTGTCGYVCPRSARVMVWETFLNGAGGLTYYCFADFNPAHLIEVARALAAVAPLEAVIAGGAAAHDQVRLGDDAIRHSAIRRDNRAALLLVNTTDRQRTATWRWDGTAARGHTTVPAMDAVLLDVRLAE